MVGFKPIDMEVGRISPDMSASRQFHGRPDENLNSTRIPCCEVPITPGTRFLTRRAVLASYRSASWVDVPSTRELAGNQ